MNIPKKPRDILTPFKRQIMGPQLQVGEKTTTWELRLKTGSHMYGGTKHKCDQTTKRGCVLVSAIGSNGKYRISLSFNR